ncbi:MAG: hypothetical protein K6A77_00570 [Clostridiales bacterium]|nr:hypothetical protein [Clostridiales bacterium]
MQNRGAQWGWVLYEGAATFLLIAIIAAGRLESLICVILLMAVLSPFLGPLGDGKGHKKKEFLVCLMMGLLGAALVAWTGLPALYILALFGFSAAGLLHSAFLTDVSDIAHFERVSALGSLCFLVCSACALWLVPELLQRAMDLRRTIGLAVVWAAAFSIPFLIYVRHRHEALPSTYRLPKEVLGSIRKSGVSMAKNRKIRSLVLAMFLCSAGISTVLVHGVARLSLDIRNMWWIVLLSLACTMLSSQAGRKWRGVQILLAWFSLCCLGCLLDLLLPGSALGVVGITCCGIRALVRAGFARIIPRDQSAAYFGIFYCLGYVGVLLGIGIGLISFANVLAGVLFLISGAILLYQRRRFVFLG